MLQSRGTTRLHRLLGCLLGRRRPLLIIGLALVMLVTLIYYVYRLWMSCAIFCLQMDGPAISGVPHCDLSLPPTVADSGIADEFVQRVLALGRQVQRKNRVLLSSVWLPEGFLWSVYYKPHLIVLNYLEHLRDAYPDGHPLLVCSSEHTCEVLESFHDTLGVATFSILRDRTNFQCEVPDYLTRSYNLKYLYAYVLMRYGGYDVVLTDTDSVMLRDSFPVLDKPLEGGLKPDLQVMTSTLDTNATYWNRPRLLRVMAPAVDLPMCPEPASQPNFCAAPGFMYLRNTGLMQMLVWEMLRQWAVHVLPGQQRLLNDLLPRYVESGLRLELLDPLLFNTMLGYTILQNGTHRAYAESVFVHAGPLRGTSEKINTMKLFGIWKPNSVFPLPPREP